MTLTQLLTCDFEDEVKSTRKLLERVPLDDAHRDFKPHEKSMPFNRLATHVADLSEWIKFAVELDVLELNKYEPRIAKTTEELLAIFDQYSEVARKALASVKDEDLEKTWALRFGGQVVYQDPRRKVIRAFLNHMVHHRAQLGVYLRMNNIAVPGVYGPSADDR